MTDTVTPEIPKTALEKLEELATSGKEITQEDVKTLSKTEISNLLNRMKRSKPQGQYTPTKNAAKKRKAKRKAQRASRKINRKK